MKIYNIELYDLPKISLNKFYSGMHWTKRKEIKDNYKLIIKNQYKRVLSKEKEYRVSYNFFFKIKPLDVSNCSAMVKLIEDVIFEDDKYDIVKAITVTSEKDTVDCVMINIREYEKDQKSKTT